MGDFDQQIWERAVESLDDSGATMGPISLRVPFVLDSVVDLIDATQSNHFDGLIDDEEFVTAMGICKNLFLAKEPRAEVAELPYIDKEGQMYVQLVLAGPKDPSS